MQRARALWSPKSWVNEAGWIVVVMAIVIAACGPGDASDSTIESESTRLPSSTTSTAPPSATTTGPGTSSTAPKGSTNSTATASPASPSDPTSDLGSDGETTASESQSEEDLPSGDASDDGTTASESDSQEDVVGEDAATESSSADAIPPEAVEEIAEALAKPDPAESELDFAGLQSTSSALTAGNNVTSDQLRRSGIVRLAVYNNGEFLKRCTGVVLRSSQITEDAWILTAAHCFYQLNKYVSDELKISVHLAPGQQAFDTEWTSEVRVCCANNGTELSADSSVHIHPEWATRVGLNPGTIDIWYDVPDLALVYFSEYVPVESEPGHQYVEYARPFFSGHMRRYDGDDVGVFGAKDGFRWARGKFGLSSKGYLVIDPNDWKTTEDNPIDRGDSGGPWIYSTWEKSSTEAYIRDGVVIGITSGPHIDISLFECSLSRPANCVDMFAMRTSPPRAEDWILSTTRIRGPRVGNLPHVDTLPWKRPPILQYVNDATGSWDRLTATSRNLGSVAFGDFGSHTCDAGSPKDDVLLAELGHWYVSWCGTTDWELLRRDPATIDELAFGDFNGDGITDAFRATGTEWLVAETIGPGPWTQAWRTLRNSTTTLTDKYGLAFGDFNGDGVTDVFRASGGVWKVSYSGTSQWKELLRSTTELRDNYGLAFGDFNGDGITDVFRASGGEWKVSHSGSGRWKKLRNSSTELTDKYGLLVGYFDGDLRADILRANGTEWLFSSGGVGTWETLKKSRVTTRRVAMANLDGDVLSDIVLVRHPIPCDLGFFNFCSNYYHLNNTAPQRHGPVIIPDTIPSDRTVPGSRSTP